MSSREDMEARSAAGVRASCERTVAPGTLPHEASADGACQGWHVHVGGDDRPLQPSVAVTALDDRTID